MLTHAGNLLGYQHFLPLEGASAFQLFARVVLVAQATLVVAALVAHRAGVTRIALAMLPGWRLPVVVVTLVLTSATVAREPAAYALELVLASIVQLVQLCTIALAVAALPPATAAAVERRFDAMLGARASAAEPGSIDRFVLLAALWTVVVAYLLAVLSYQRHPHVPDEVSYLFHARYLAAGMLAMPAPPVPAAFDVDLIALDAAGWYSPVPPGWPAILAVGVRLGAPWLVNPVLAGINVLLAYQFLRELYSRRTARLVVLLLCASPWALFMAMNLMTHTFSFTCALVAALAVARMRRNGSLAWATAGGLALAVISLIRPLEAGATAVLLGLWSLSARWRGMRLVPSAVLTIVAMAGGALNLVYNQAMTGDPRAFPLMLYSDRVFGAGTNALGFGVNRGIGWGGLDPFPGHGAIDVVVNTNLNVTLTNIELLGWSCGSLLAVVLLVVIGRLRRPDWYMVAAVATIVGVHAFYWFSGGPDFAARYWFLILLPLLALAARGIEETDAQLERAGARPGALAAAGLLTVLALAVFVPWRAADKYYHYRGMRPDVRTLAREHGFGRSLVLVRGKRHPDYHSAVVNNPIDLRADAPIYARDSSVSVRALLLDAYPDRPVWILEGPSVTRAGFQASGPLTNAQARALP